MTVAEGFLWRLTSLHAMSHWRGRERGRHLKLGLQKRWARSCQLASERRPEARTGSRSFGVTTEAAGTSGPDTRPGAVADSVNTAGTRPDAGTEAGTSTVSAERGETDSAGCDTLATSSPLTQWVGTAVSLHPLRRLLARTFVMISSSSPESGTVGIVRCLRGGLNSRSRRSVGFAVG